jgi:alpha-L-fucosidase
MKKLASIIFFFISISPVLLGQNKIAVDPALKTRKEVLDDFMDKRFGMFIHWGPVSLRGTEIGWSRGHQVATPDYDNLYKEFNPVLFDADTWVRIAKDAGMKYLTITSKHHDGFCLWPSAYTEYDIMSTPFKKDLLGELAKACKKYNIRFCIYYSILDWHDPDYPIHNDGSNELDSKANMNKFVLTIKNQLKELVTRYDPYMLWFDGQWESPWTDEMGADLYSYLKGLKKDLIINNRLGKEMTAIHDKEVDYTKMIGDYDTPEQKVGKLNLDFPWESCITIGNQWAWKPNDQIKSLKECLHTLIKTASGNGNLLFNVGPMPDGRIEHRQIELLKHMGSWLKTYGESIYETNGGPYTPSNDYSATRKDNKVFVHLFNNDKNELELPILQGANVMNASMINGAAVKMQTKDGRYFFTLPNHLPDSISNVLVLLLDKEAIDLPLIK